MPIVLDTPFDAGELSGQTFGEIKIIKFIWTIEGDKNIRIILELGDTVNGEWVPAPASVPRITGEIRDVTMGHGDNLYQNLDYTNFIQNNISTYTAVAAALYDWVKTNFARYQGTTQ